MTSIWTMPRKSGRGRADKTGVNPLLRVVAGFGALTMASLVLGPLPAGATTAESVTGTVTLVGDTPTNRFLLDTAKGQLQVDGTADADYASLDSGQTVTMKVADESGGAVDFSTKTPDAVTAASSVVEVAPATERATIASTTHTITAVRANFVGSQIKNQDGSTRPAVLDDAGTKAAVDNAVADAIAYWSDVSAGAITFTKPAAVIDSAPISGEPCNVTDPAGEVADKIGFTPGPNKHLVIFSPPCVDPQWEGVGGFGTVSDIQTEGGWVVMLGASSIRERVNGSGAAVLAHELGHNLGLGHANELACAASGVQKSDLPVGGCFMGEYDAWYSVMGTSLQGWTPGHLSHPQMERLGLEDSGSVVTLNDSSDDQSVTLSPRAGESGVRTVVLKIANGDSYALEYRKPVGVDSDLLGPDTGEILPSGVLVWKVPAIPNPASPPTFKNSKAVRANEAYLLDMNPADNPQTATSAFLAGGGFDGNPTIPLSSPVELANWTVTVQSAGSGAQVFLSNDGTIPTPPPPPAPDAPPAPAAPTVTNPSSLDSYVYKGRLRVSWTYSGTANGTLSYSLMRSVGGVTALAKAAAGRNGVSEFRDLGFGRSVTYWLRVCNTLSGATKCTDSPKSTRTTSPNPVGFSIPASYGSDGKFPVSVTGITGSTWRVYWCNTRIAGSSCNPLTASSKGYTAARAGGGTASIDPVRKTCRIGTSSCAGSWGSGTTRLNDTLRVTVVTARTPLATVGFRLNGTSQYYNNYSAVPL